MILDKPWLMGIRRGWQQQLDLLRLDVTKSSREVVASANNLRIFLVNLDDQIRFIRRGAFIEYDEKYKKILQAVHDAVDHFENRTTDVIQDFVYANKRYQAEAQFNYPRGKLELTDEEMRRVHNDAQYQEIFYIKYPKLKNPKKDLEFNTERLEIFQKHEYPEILEALTKTFDNLMKILYAAAKVVRNNTFAPGFGEELYKEFDLSGVKVVIEDSEVAPFDIRGYIKNIDQAYQKMRSAGFGKLWRGKILVQCVTCGGTNSHGAHWGVGGRYIVHTDTIILFSRPSEGLPALIIHEMAHRYWFKNMSSTQRQRFETWIESGKVTAVSDYGKTTPAEAFAEVMSYMIDKRTVNQDQLESFQSVIKTSVQRVAMRYQTKGYHNLEVVLDEPRIQAQSPPVEDLQDNPRGREQNPSWGG